MRKIFFISICMFFALTAHSQQLGTMSELLKKLEVSDTTSNAKVVVVNHTAIDLTSPVGMVSGYKIRLIFDNSQNARNIVENERLRYLEMYPADSTYIAYKAPYFKLTVGDFLNHQEALMHWSKVVKHFRNAFIVKDSVNISYLMSDERRYELGEMPIDTMLNVLDSTINDLGINILDSTIINDIEIIDITTDNSTLE